MKTAGDSAVYMTLLIYTRPPNLGPPYGCALSWLIMAAFLALFLSLMSNAFGQEVYCYKAAFDEFSVIDEPPNMWVTIIGNIFNNTTSTYDSNNKLKIVSELYDASNKLIGVESANPEIQVLNAYEFSPFKIQTNIANDTLDHFIIRC